MNGKTLKLKALAGAVIGLCAMQAMAGQYGNLYVFGDSLSDAGAFTNVVGPDVNKFTNNPGTVWAQNLGARYGIGVTPGYAFDGTQFVATGGNDYAIGGARIAGTPGVFSASAALAAVIVPVLGQVGSHLGQHGGAADGRALYAVWGGANDVFYQAGAVGAGAITATQAVANLVTAAGQEAMAVVQLRAVGARQVIVVALPDMGATPYGASDPANVGAPLSQLSGFYNLALKQSLVGAGASNVLYLDPTPLLADVAARPAAWGITNTTVPACGAAASLGCGPSMQIPNSGNFLFSDGVHPTVYTHRIVSDWIYSALEAPIRMASLGVLAVEGLYGHWQTVDDQLRATAGAGDGSRFFVSGGYAPGDFGGSGSTAISGDNRSVTLGAEHRWNATRAGVALGLGHGNYDFGDGAGGANYKSTTVSAFVGQRLNALGLSGTVSYASHDFDTRRSFGAITDNGNPTARQWGVRLAGSYDLTADNIVHGPVVAVATSRAKVDDFAESGITAMHFGEQTRNSLRHSVGWQGRWAAGGDAGLWSPYVRLSHEKEYRKNDGFVTAGTTDTPLTFSTPVAGNSTKGYGLLAAGTTLRQGTAIYQIGLSTTISREGGNQQSLTLGVSF